MKLSRQKLHWGICKLGSWSRWREQGCLGSQGFNLIPVFVVVLAFRGRVSQDFHVCSGFIFFVHSCVIYFPVQCFQEFFDTLMGLDDNLFDHVSTLTFSGEKGFIW